MPCSSRLIKYILASASLLLILGFTYRPDKNTEGLPLSPTDFVLDNVNQQIIVAQKTGKRIDFIDYQSGKLTASISTRLPPTGICLSGDGRAFVSCTYSTGELLVIDLLRREILEVISVGHGAICPVFSPESNTLYVANQYDDDVSVIDLGSKKEIGRIPVLRQPMCMDITPDGHYLYVANLLPDTRADLDTVAADVSVIDLNTHSVSKHLKLSNGSNALRGIKISPDGKYAFVSHNLGRFQVPTSQLDKGWMNTSALSVLDIERQNVWATVLLDDSEKGAAGAWGIDVNEQVIVLTHAATHEYSLIDYPAFISKLEAHPKLSELSYDLSFMTGIRKRVPVQGEGPRAIVLKGDRVITAHYFSDALQIDDLNTGTVISNFEINPGLIIDSARLGEMIFNDARYCFQQWQSCTGCHPNDARTDGLNWDLLNDGIGNPKNCKSMLLAHLTPPAMITGIRPNAEIAVRAGFTHIQFAMIEEDKARAVDHYLKSLKAVPSPHLIGGDLSEAAIEGAELYMQLGCGDCHSGPYYTDGKKYKMGAPGTARSQEAWDTPTLIEVWRTAPYLHDGRSATLKEVFKREMHGLDKELGEQELDYLVEFVLSL